jgi:uncharacterized protein YqgC (DUF456 family)
MDILQVILAVICLLAGLVGCIVPALPGPPLSYAALLLLQWSGYGDLSSRFLLIWAAVVIAVTLLDYYLPVWMTRRFGGSRHATIGAAIGLIAGFFILPPLGIVVCPFLGAFIGELIHDNTDGAKAFKVAMGSLAAFMMGTGLKLIVSGIITFYGIRSFFV